MPVLLLLSTKSMKDTSRVIRMMIIGDATTWSVILTTLESAFMIVIWLLTQTSELLLKPSIHTHSSFPRQSYGHQKIEKLTLNFYLGAYPSGIP
jgi:hypothetical protein